jgi:hypothetical protein
MTVRVCVPFLPSRERKRPVLNPALVLGAWISGAALRTVIERTADIIRVPSFNRVLVEVGGDPMDTESLGPLDPQLSRWAACSAGSGGRVVVGRERAYGCAR